MRSLTIRIKIGRERGGRTLSVNRPAFLPSVSATIIILRDHNQSLSQRNRTAEARREAQRETNFMKRSGES